MRFIRFLNAIEAGVPAGKIAHVILDNCAARKHSKVRQWLDRHGEVRTGISLVLAAIYFGSEPTANSPFIQARLSRNIAAESASLSLPSAQQREKLGVYSG
jgi:hypothetical protein